MKYLQLLFLVLLSNELFAINTNISGIVNSYAELTAITVNSVTLGTVSPTHTFTCGDRVMIIQMKGASIVTTNDPTFGDISNINNAGNYEMATVASISGSTITFLENLTKSYTISGLVQAVYVPHYEDATVTSLLSAQAWNGTTGGVLAIEVDGTLTLNADIDVSELGFRGGNFHPTTQVTPNKNICLDLGFFKLYEGNVGTAYRYDNSNKEFAVEKGESITTHATYLWGRGKLASAGGGGGIESGGGGGGANIGAGGDAGSGNPTSSGCGWNPDVFGVGGTSLSSHYSNDKIFLGGGSGAGNNGNDFTAAANYFGGMSTIAAPGRNGGGIIYIDANTVAGNSNSIISNGENGYTGITTGNFGGGGGGAGGTIILNVNQFNTNLIVNAKGGIGSSVRVIASVAASRRRGAGGGGGGGNISIFSTAIPSGVDTSTAGGTGGLSYDTNGTLRSSHYGQNGRSGSVSYNYSEIGSNNSAINLVSITTTTSEVVNSTRRIDFAESNLLASLNSNGNNLGSTAITTTIGSNGPFVSTGCSEDEYYLPRTFTVVPTSQPTSTCDVSLYITATELASFIAFTNSQSTTYKNCWGAVNTINDLMVSVFHSDGSSEPLTPTITYITCSDIYKFDVQVSKFSTFYIHSNKGSLAGNVLPLEWLSFEANYISKAKAELSWATGVEINNDGFFVEKSFDGENFEELAWINGKGNYNAKTDYNYIDNIDLYSKYSTVYYRLNQVDYNGEQEYSEIKSLKLKSYNYIGEIYPNPTFSKASLDVINNSESICTIYLYNSIGKMVYSKNNKISKEGKVKIDIELENLKPGVYTCIIQIAGEKTLRRLIKK